MTENNEYVLARLAALQSAYEEAHWQRNREFLEAADSGLSVRRIAAAANLSPGTVQRILVRARRRR